VVSFQVQNIEWHFFLQILFSEAAQIYFCLFGFSENNPFNCFANFQILLQTTGVVFPKCPVDAPPIFTPPATHNSSSPRYAAGSLSDRMSSDVETLRLCPFPWHIGLISHFLAQLICLVILTVIFFYSLGDLNNIRNVTDLLNDMVHALNPSDRTV